MKFVLARQSSVQKYSIPFGLLFLRWSDSSLYNVLSFVVLTWLILRPIGLFMAVKVKNSSGSRISQTGSPTPGRRGCANLLCHTIFAENCMKWNDLDWGEAMYPWDPQLDKMQPLQQRLQNSGGGVGGGTKGNGKERQRRSIILWLEESTSCQPRAWPPWSLHSFMASFKSYYCLAKSIELLGSATVMEGVFFKILWSLSFYNLHSLNPCHKQTQFPRKWNLPKKWTDC